MDNELRYSGLVWIGGTGLVPTGAQLVEQHHHAEKQTHCASGDVLRCRRISAYGSPVQVFPSTHALELLTPFDTGCPHHAR